MFGAQSEPDMVLDALAFEAPFVQETDCVIYVHGGMYELAQQVYENLAFVKCDFTKVTIYTLFCTVEGNRLLV